MKDSTTQFADRRLAGIALAREVERLHLQPPVVVVGLPRGGVPVAFEVAQALDAPLDVLSVRKVGVPGNPELAIGAVAVGDIVVREGPGSGYYSDLPLSFWSLASRQCEEVARREHTYRPARQPLHFTDETVVLVDDGLATGCTMLAAIRAARKAGARRIVAAAPVTSREAMELIAPEVDSMVVLRQPVSLLAVGHYYRDFSQVSDAEVRALLDQSAEFGLAHPDRAAGLPGTART